MDGGGGLLTCSAGSLMIPSLPFTPRSLALSHLPYPRAVPMVFLAFMKYKDTTPDATASTNILRLGPAAKLELLRSQRSMTQ